LLLLHVINDRQFIRNVKTNFIFFIFFFNIIRMGIANVIPFDRVLQTE